MLSLISFLVLTVLSTSARFLGKESTPYADVLKVGDEVDVRITEIDFDKKRVSLSMKELLPKPNADAEAESEEAEDAE